MQEVGTQNQSQSHNPASTAQHRIIEPIQTSPSSKLPIILSTILILLTTASTIYLYYQNQLLKQEILQNSKQESNQPPVDKDNNQQEIKLEWNTYQSDKFNYKIEYPQDWKAFSVEPGVGEMDLKDDSKGFITYPNIYTGANAKTSISIETDDPTNTAPYTEDWWKNTQTKFFKIEKDTKTTFAGQTARVTEGDYDGYGFPAHIKVIEFYSPDKKTLFSIIITDQKESPSTKIINQVLDTFKLIPASQAPTLQTYTNKQYKFSFNYPLDYKVKDVKPTGEGTLLRIGFAPKTMNEDVSGIIEVSNLSYFEYMARFKLQYQQIKELEIVVQRPIIVDGIEGSELVYKNTVNNIQFSQIFVPFDNLVYSIPGSSTDNTIVSQISSTFRFIK